MTDTCPTCGASVTAADGTAVCTSCGSDLRAGADSTTAWQPINHRFGRFEIVAEVGAGAFGRVFKAIDPQLDRVVALKIPHESRLGGPSARERFLREARNAARLSHPNVVAVYEVGEHEGVPFLVSEFVDGPSLADTLTARRPLFADAARLVAALADALQEAHTLGVIHRDVKPSNVLIAPDGTPKLTDFGIAKRDTAEADLTTEGEILGSPAYMSPEQARGDARHADGRTDVYSLGAVLFQMLTGEVPFRGNARMTIHQVLHDEPSPPRKLNDRVPRDLETVCLKCLEKTPERRYATAKELADDLRRFLNDQPVNARPPSALERARKFTRRNRALVLGTAGTVAALLLGVGGTGLALREARAEAVRANDAATREAAEAARANDALTRLSEAKRQQDEDLARIAAAAAKLATQRGQWETALGHYRVALNHKALSGATDDVELRLGMLTCYGALYEYKQYREELARLAARSDLGAHRGMVRLHQGLVGFFSSDPTADPVGAFRESLTLGLPRAEEHYAKAVLATTLPEMIDHLRAAIREDQFHIRAHDILVMALMISGRAEEAREVLTRFELLAPNANNVIAYRVIDRAFAGDLPAALRKSEDLKPALGDKGVATVRAFAQIMHDVTREDWWWEPDIIRMGKLVGELLALAPQLSEMMKDERAGATWSGFNIFRLGILRPFADSPLFKNAGLSTLTQLTDPAATIRQAKDLARTIPIGLFSYLEGNGLEREGKLAEAEAAYRKALETPSFVPITRRARFSLLMVQDRLTSQLPPGPAREKKRAEARATFRDVVRAGTYPPLYTELLLATASRLEEYASGLAVAEEWLQRNPNEPRALSALASAAIELGAFERWTQSLDQQLAKQPNSSELLNQRSVAAFRQRIYSQAITTALEALKNDPSNRYPPGNLAAISERIDALAAVYPYLREKLRLWQPLHLAQIGNYRCAVVALGDPATAAPETALALAAVYSTASVAAAADKALPPEIRAEYADQLAGRAIELLRQVDAAGYLADSNRASHLRTERGFDAVRSRPGFPVALGSVSPKKP